MEKLVEYTTALLAKEKGFKEETTYYYAPDKSKDHRDYIPHDYNSRGLLSAPTQSQLQAWLRNNFDMHCYALPKKDKRIFSNRGNLYIAQIIWEGYIKDSNDIDESGYTFEKYEQALENTLLTGLKDLQI